MKHTLVAIVVAVLLCGCGTTGGDGPVAPKGPARNTAASRRRKARSLRRQAAGLEKARDAEARLLEGLGERKSAEMLRVSIATRTALIEHMKAMAAVLEEGDPDDLPPMITKQVRLAGDSDVRYTEYRCQLTLEELEKVAERHESPAAHSALREMPAVARDLVEAKRKLAELRNREAELMERMDRMRVDVYRSLRDSEGAGGAAGAETIAEP
jgi:hypothetical protein